VKRDDAFEFRTLYAPPLYAPRSDAPRSDALRSDALRSDAPRKRVGGPKLFLNDPQGQLTCGVYFPRPGGQDNATS
jgi:hypothetical protein